MKKSILFGLLTMIILSGKSQTKDPVLNKFLASIPSGWSYSFNDTALTITKKDSVYMVYHNKINESGMPVEKDKEEIDCKSKGIATVAFIKYRVEKKWSENKIHKANNHIIYSKIKKLFQQYKIKNITHKFDSYITETPDEKKRLDLYKQQKNQLEQNLLNLPNYNSQLYSVFYITAKGCQTALEDFYPIKTSVECFSIQNIANELLIVIK